jgi:hypothetical protein
MVPCWNQVYIKNFVPEKDREGTDHITDLLKHLEHEPALKIAETTEPCVFFYGVGRFKLTNLDENQINYIRNKKIHFFLYEPLTFFIKHKHNRFYYTEFPSNISVEKIMSEELESIESICQDYDVTGTVYVCDYNIDFLRHRYKNLEIYTYDMFIRAKHNPNLELRTIQVSYKNFNKKFWCGNKRYTLARHLSMAYVSNYEGNYSWNFNCDFELIRNNGCFSFEQLKFSENKIYTNLQNGIKNLNNSNFYLDTISEDKIKVESLEAMTMTPMYHPDNFAKNYWDKYLECFCPIINETRFFQPTSNFSEKTLHAFFLKRPFILVAPPGTLEYLKKLGFKTFESFWDESYDKEFDHTKRFVKIFKLIDYIESLTLQECKNIYNEMYETIEYNYQKVLKFYENKDLS